jgi:tannase
MLEFNLTSLIGEEYYCAAETSSSLGFGFGRRQMTTGSSTTTTPEQSGTISAEGVAVVQAIYDGLFNSAGQRAYLSWQIGSLPSDGNTIYDNTTGTWKLDIPSTGGEWVTKFVQLLELDNLDSLDNVTYDTAVEWMKTGYWRFLDSLQTTKPDLTAFRNAGGKLLQ